MILTAKDERDIATTLLGAEGAIEIHKRVHEVSREEEKIRADLLGNER